MKIGDILLLIGEADRQNKMSEKIFRIDNGWQSAHDTEV